MDRIAWANLYPLIFIHEVLDRIVLLTLNLKTLFDPFSNHRLNMIHIREMILGSQSLSYIKLDDSEDGCIR